MATVWIDGRAYDVDPSRNVLEVCLGLRINLPFFCWHPALGSVGACRQCAVKQFKDEKDTRGRLVMACMTPAAEGTRISVADPEAVRFRESIVEWLMTNHPHDCPVCDEGGECHLQDMTLMTGHAYRRFRFRKRTYRNQDLGPFVNHEMNRCIQCYRCVRFYRDYAGGRDFDVFAAHDHVYFGRREDGVLESEFSGNLVEVCPTGVFTDKTLKRHPTRKWDLQTAPSICAHCSLGCNTIPGERYGTLRRIRARYNGHVNGYFLCDRGRYGYEFVNGERRIRAPLLPHGPEAPAETVAREDALRRLAPLFRDPARVIGIGSPRASLEANFALETLAGRERFYAGVAKPEARLLARVLDALRRGPSRTPSLREVEQADAVLVLGEDPVNAAPMLALALTQASRRKPRRIAERLRLPAWNEAALQNASQDERGPLFMATPAGTKLDAFAMGAVRATPEEIDGLGRAVAHALDPAFPETAGLPEALKTFAGEVARALAEAERPLVVSGTSCGSEAIVEAAASVARASAGARAGRAAELCFVVPECNSLGLAMLAERDLDDALAAMERGEVDTAVVLENDLFRRAEPERLERALAGVRHLVVLDHVAHETAARAEVVLPAATFAESDGTFVNNEGRAQRFFQVFVAAGDVKESWRWIGDLAAASGRATPQWKDLDAITAALASAHEPFHDLPRVAPGAGYRVAGLKVAREAHRYSGRTSMFAGVTVHEPMPPQDPDAPLAFSMEGYEGPPDPALIPRFWAPGWNSIQSLHRFQEEINGPLEGGDPGLRLIEPAPSASPSAASASSPGPQPAGGGAWRVVLLPHIFGSEELSALVPAVAELASGAYVALHPEDAAAIGCKDGKEMKVEIGGREMRLPVRVRADLAQGLAGLPAGSAAVGYIRLPARARISR